MKQIVVVCANSRCKEFLSMDNCNLIESIAYVCNSFITEKVRIYTGKKVENRYPAWEDAEKKIPQLYKRNDLYQWAEEARKNGEMYFYAKPEDPKNPYGKLVKCEPDYHYESHLAFGKEFCEGIILETPARKIFYTDSEMKYAGLIDSLESKGFVAGKDYCLSKDFGGNYACMAFVPVNDDRYEKLRDLLLDGFKLCN